MTGNSIVSQPDVSITIVPAQQKVDNTAHRVLVVGQLISGTAVSGDLQSNIGNSNEEDALFGKQSMIAGMIRAYKKINEVSPIDAIGLDDPAGVAANGTVTFTGDPSVDGSLTVIIASAANHTLTISVVDADTATTIGDKLVVAVDADLTIPVSAANAAGVVTITALNVGLEGNDITLKSTGTVTGVTVAIAAMASGTLSPALTTVFDVVAELRYQTVIWPFSYGLDDLTGFLDPRFNVTNDIQDGIGITTSTDTFANLGTAGNLENSQSLVIIGFNVVADTLFAGSSMLEQGVNVSSELAAIRALRLTEDASIGQFVIATAGARDTFGGPALASFPYFNTPFPSLPLIPTGKGFDRSEIEALATAGVVTIGNNKAGNETIAGEVVTTYKTDSAGNPDVSFKYANFVDTSVNVREYMFNNVKSRFAQSRLTEGDVVEGRAMANEAIIRGFLGSLYDDLTGPDFVLTQAGEDAQNFFNDNLVITIDLADGKVTADMKVPLVTQFRTFIATLQIAFSTEA